MRKSESDRTGINLVQKVHFGHAKQSVGEALTIILA